MLHTLPSNSLKVFGTVVDWRSTVTHYLETKYFEKLNSASSSIACTTRHKCAQVDWGTFAQEWRTRYYKFTSELASLGTSNESSIFKTVDEHHLDSLRELLRQYEIDILWIDDEILEISRIWHYLDGWPDSSRGLKALKERGFTICTLSNGNTSLLLDMAKHANLPWTYVFSADRFGAYKPNSEVYICACKEVGLEPGRCAMVAAHLGDLQAAKECGLQTIYIERPGEEAWDVEKIREVRLKGWVDLWIEAGEDINGGGILEVVRRYEVGKVP